MDCKNVMSCQDIETIENILEKTKSRITFVNFENINYFQFGIKIVNLFPDPQEQINTTEKVLSLIERSKNIISCVRTTYRDSSNDIEKIFKTIKNYITYSYDETRDSFNIRSNTVLQKISDIFRKYPNCVIENFEILPEESQSGIAIFFSNVKLKVLGAVNEAKGCIPDRFVSAIVTIKQLAKYLCHIMYVLNPKHVKIFVQVTFPKLNEDQVSVVVNYIMTYCLYFSNQNIISGAVQLFIDGKLNEIKTTEEAEEMIMVINSLIEDAKANPTENNIEKLERKLNKSTQMINEKLNNAVFDPSNSLTREKAEEISEIFGNFSIDRQKLEDDNIKNKMQSPAIYAGTSMMLGVPYHMRPMVYPLIKPIIEYSDQMSTQEKLLYSGAGLSILNMNNTENFRHNLRVIYKIIKNEETNFKIERKLKRKKGFGKLIIDYGDITEFGEDTENIKKKSRTQAINQEYSRHPERYDVIESKRREYVWRKMVKRVKPANRILSVVLLSVLFRKEITESLDELIPLVEKERMYFNSKYEEYFNDTQEESLELNNDSYV